MEQLEEGFYHKNTNYIGEMVIWNTQKIRTRGIQLTARGANSIGYGRSRDTLGITTIIHLIKPMPKSITESTQRTNKTKSRQELEKETVKCAGRTRIPGHNNSNPKYAYSTWNITTIG